MQSDGSVVGWGRQVVVERSALRDLVVVAAGGWHTLGLRGDAPTAVPPTLPPVALRPPLAYPNQAWGTTSIRFGTAA